MIAVPLTVALAVSKNAPLWLPAFSTMVATPLASLSALPASGVNCAVLSLLVTVSSTFGSTVPLAFLMTARSVALRSGATEVVAAPSAPSRLSATVAAVVGAAAQPGKFGSRLGSCVVQPLLPEPPPPQPASSAAAAPAARYCAQRADVMLLVF